MMRNRRELITQAAAGAALAAGAPARAAEAYQASWESLSARRTPDWWRDAKFGIWAHWSAQCVPEQGDWYARLMYVQGSRAYEHHLKTWGHPSKAGFMEIENLWKAEHWDPDALMALYKAAGAKYFVALANHHDNFDTYASKHHAWNATRIGPKRDIIGTWKRAAAKAGLRFGVSNHSSHAWHWWQTAYGYDAEGPMKGQRYDAYRLTKADGAGKWWAGLDPQDLYTGPHMVAPDGIVSIKAMDAWHAAHDGQWLETASPDAMAFARNWALRASDLIDSYDPDYVYFDDSGLPFGQIGLDVVAKAYTRHPELVATAKELSDLQRQSVVEDVERGYSDRLRELPWQTCTCIGNWHYDRQIFEQHRYVGAKAVIQRLADIVSKNGNLLLSVPVRGDGTIDEDERAILGELAAWMAANGEAIFATRPWKRFGEGPTASPSGKFSEGGVKPFTGEDLRFTTKGGDLFVLAMERPADGRLRVKALAAGSAGEVERVELAAGGAALAFHRDGEALVVELPERTTFVPAVRVRGRGLA